MAKRHEFNLGAEIAECDRIWMCDETMLDRELADRGLDLGPLVRRMEEMLALAGSAHAFGAALQAGVSGTAAQGPRNPLMAAPQKRATKAIEIAGKVKWFDAGKGYGFIEPDGGGADVMLHISCLQAAGYHAAYEGARVHVLADRGAKGMQAVEIIDMDESKAIHPSMVPQRTRVIVVAETDWERATVKWYNREKGFGFLTRGEGTADVFVHADTLRRYGFPALKPDQMLEVRSGKGRSGWMAAELRRTGEQGGLPAVH